MGVYLYPNNTETELKNAYIGIPFPESIVLDKSSISLTTVGQTEQLTATIEPTISDHSVTWSSDDTTVATVDTTGLVTCVTPGECTITATTVNGLTATCGVIDQSWKPGANTIAYYPLNSTYTNTDQSGNGNNGTTTGTIIYDIISGEFSSNNYIDIPTVIPYGSNPFTISVWCIPYSVSGNQYHIFNQFNSSSNNTAVDVYIYNGNINVWSKGSNDWNGVTTVSANTWYNFILTYNGSTLTFYKNGTSMGTKNRTISSTSPNYAWIGKGGELAGAAFFDGKISNLIIENKVRTAQEIADYYDLTKSLYGIS